MTDVLFKVGLYENYLTINPKDENTLYFTSDTLQIFKGDKEYTKPTKLITSLPGVGIPGCLYINTTTFTLHMYVESEWKKLNKGYATVISDSASDDDVPTTKAVQTYVNNKIAEVTGLLADYVSDVTYTSSTGNLSVTKGGEATTTMLSGVTHNPTYDQDTRTITLPIFGGDSLVISLGKDLVVQSGHLSDDENSIVLVLTSGDEITIPVGSLIDVYTGLATQTASVTVSPTNEISVNVKVSATANNAIVVEEDGLYVPIPDSYTKAQVDEKIGVLNSSLTTHTGDTNVHVTAEKQTEWDAKATTEQVTQAKNEAIESATTTASADATTKANKALTDAKEYADEIGNTAQTEIDKKLNINMGAENAGKLLYVDNDGNISELNESPFTLDENGVLLI